MPSSSQASLRDSPSATCSQILAARSSLKEMRGSGCCRCGLGTASRLAPGALMSARGAGLWERLLARSAARLTCRLLLAMALVLACIRGARSKLSFPAGEPLLPSFFGWAINGARDGHGAGDLASMLQRQEARQQRAERG